VPIAELLLEQTSRKAFQSQMMPHPDRIWRGNHGSGLDFSALAEA